MTSTQTTDPPTFHKHACPVRDCFGAECFDGMIEGCGHPTKSATNPDAGGEPCPWGPWPCPDGDPS